MRILILKMQLEFPQGDDIPIPHGIFGDFAAGNDGPIGAV
jgi:hypothetical protein